MGGRHLGEEDEDGMPLVVTGISYLERRAMAAALAALFGAGGLLTGLSILMPHPEEVNEAGGATCAVVALVAAAAVWFWGYRLPLGGFQGLIALGTASISFGIHFGGYAAGTPSFGLFYLWVIVYSFSFSRVFATGVHGRRSWDASWPSRGGRSSRCRSSCSTSMR